MADKRIKFCGLPLYKRETKGDITQFTVLGIPAFKQKWFDNGRYRKNYLFGVRIRKKVLASNSECGHQPAPKQERKPAPKSGDPFGLKDNELNIGIKAEGGLGDILITGNWLALLREKIGYEGIRIDVFAPNKMHLLQTVFNGTSVANNLHDKLDVGLSDCRFDLLILMLRVPVVLHAKLNKIYEHSPALFDVVQMYQRMTAQNRRLFVNRPFCDGQGVQKALIQGLKRYNEPEGEHLPMEEKFHLEVNVSIDDKAYLKSLGLPKKFISVHRGVDQRSSQNSVKQWPFEYYNILIRKIKKQYPELPIVQLGVSEARCPAFENVDVNLVGKTSLEQIKAILKNSFIHIDGEGGMVHLRHSMNAGASIVMFGATSVDFFGYSENINLTGDGCSHWCEWMSTNWQAQCARGYDRPPCMYSLIPEKVFEAFIQLMEKEDV